jgi:hypothetical protein
LSIYKNGTQFQSIAYNFKDSAYDVQSSSITKLINLAETDYVEAFVYQNAGSTRGFYIDTSFWGHKV